MPEKLIDKNKDSQNVNLSINASEFNYQLGKNQGKTLVFKNITSDENISLLRVPESLLDHLNTDPGKMIIHYPIDHFKTYNNISTTKTIIDSIPVKSNEDSSRFESQTNIEPNEKSSSDSILALWRWYASRQYYTIPDDHSIYYLSGKIRPESYTNSGSGYMIWQEREIFLNGNNDTAELIADYYSAPQNYIRLEWLIYNGGERHDIGYINVPRSSLPHQYDYYFVVDSPHSQYQMWFYDPLATPGQEWNYFFYPDSTPSSKIIRIFGTRIRPTVL